MKKSKEEELILFKKVLNTKGLPEEVFSLILNLSDFGVAAIALNQKTWTSKFSGGMLMAKVVHETFEFMDTKVMKDMSMVKPSSLTKKEWERLTNQNREAIKFIRSLRNTASHYDSNEIRGKFKTIRKFPDDISADDYSIRLVSVMVFGKVLSKDQLKDTLMELLIVVSKTADLYIRTYFPALIDIVTSKTGEKEKMAAIFKAKNDMIILFALIDDLKTNFDKYWDDGVKAFAKEMDSEGPVDDDISQKC